MCLIMKEDCIFCKIAKGEIHSATVYEDSHFTVILDVNPATKGHCLIIPTVSYTHLSFSQLLMMMNIFLER